MRLPAGLQRLVRHRNGLQRIVGMTIGISSLVIAVANTFTDLNGAAFRLIRLLQDEDVSVLVLLGLVAIGTAFWDSPVARWTQIAIFFATTVLSALSARAGDISSAIFLVFGLILISEYELGVTAFYAGILFSIVIYPSALVMGLRAHSQAYVSESAGMLLGVLVVFILYASVMGRHQYRHRQEALMLESRVKERTAELEKALSERKVMLHEIYHRVKNNLQIIASLLVMERDRSTPQSREDSIDASIQRIHAMSLVHAILYRADALHEIDLAHYVGELLRGLEQSMGSEVAIILQAEQTMVVDPDIAIPIGILLTELVTNAVKYAYPTGRRGEVEVSIKPAGDGAIELVVADWGGGMPAWVESEGSKTLGMSIVRAIVEQLEGRLTLDRSSGTRWTLLVRVNR